MNFKDSIASHVNWKIRLRMFLNGSDEQLESAVVSQDNQCELGKWIYEQGTQYSHLPAYHTLKSEHAKLHKYAGDIVRKAEFGDKEGAKALLNGEQFTKISSNLVVMIMDMEKKYNL
ncbi:CZB domain-containing protein [Anaerolineales bacterium HSG6]|nr:CZB domain-containing protein [Anaerolineales bacterium HSG6]MDM8529931.1 CZB domain-containing protein [Anaerolineales bacterium HSG25]